MKSKLILMFALLGFALMTSASDVTKPEKSTIKTEVVTTDITTPVSDVNLVQGAVEVQLKNISSKVVATEWRDVPDGYGGAQIQEGYAWMPTGTGGVFYGKTGGVSR